VFYNTPHKGGMGVAAPFRGEVPADVRLDHNPAAPGHKGLHTAQRGNGAIKHLVRLPAPDRHQVVGNPLWGCKKFSHPREGKGGSCGDTAADGFFQKIPSIHGISPYNLVLFHGPALEFQSRRL